MGSTDSVHPAPVPGRWGSVAVTVDLQQASTYLEPITALRNSYNVQVGPPAVCCKHGRHCRPLPGRRWPLPASAGQQGAGAASLPV